MSATPIRLWSLQVPPTGEIVALEELGIPLNVSITMAAIDPTQEIKGDGPKLSTLRILHQNMTEPEIDDFDDDESIDSDLASGGEEEDSDDDEEDSEEEEEKSAKPKGKGANKKAVVVGKKDDEDDEDEDDSDDDDILLEDLDSDDEDDYEEVVVCTLDPSKAYQQPLQLTVGDGEPVFFKASGAYTIYLTGNYVTEPRQLPPSYDDDEEDDLYDDEDDEDESMDEDEEYADILAKIKAGAFDEDSDDESDELDDIDNPRITEVESDEEEVPALVSSKKPEETLSKKEKTAAAKAAQLKAKAAETAAKVISAKDQKKRSADEMEIDSTATSETLPNGTTVTTATATASVTDTPPSSLSKKQQKKLKANSGEAVNVTPTEKKKVQFASQLEQGPTPNGNKSPAQPIEKAKADKDEKPTTQSSKIRTVNGVKIEDHKLGQGPEAKNGQKVGMRYIGKLTDGKVFDSNKKGKPFTFQLGKGEVIKGWDIGVAGMKVGGERKLVIPANLAYGNKALPGIPKNSTLVFEVKLLEIK